MFIRLINNNNQVFNSIILFLQIIFNKIIEFDN